MICLSLDRSSVTSANAGSKGLALPQRDLIAGFGGGALLILHVKLVFEEDIVKLLVVMW